MSLGKIYVLITMMEFARLVAGFLITGSRRSRTIFERVPTILAVTLSHVLFLLKGMFLLHVSLRREGSVEMIRDCDVKRPKTGRGENKQGVLTEALGLITGCAYYRDH